MAFRNLLRTRQHNSVRSIIHNMMATTPIHCSNGIRWISSENGIVPPVTRNFDVRMVEVGPRDGLQNEPSMIVSVQQKVQLIQLLMNAGCHHIEVGSFVNPKAVPNMANSPEVVQQLRKLTHAATTTTSTTTGVQFSILVPTLRYLQEALMYRDTIHEIAIFASVSESFSQKNINCSIAESMIRFREIMNVTKEFSLPVRGYLSCAIACPYDGPTLPQQVGHCTEQLLELGCYEVALSDTIGIGTPQSTKAMIDEALMATGGQPNVLAVHFHDTYGQALRNILVALEREITTIDSSVAGLGGCPYAKGATGNVATEDVVYMLNGMNVSSGLDIEKLVDASEYISGILNRPILSKAGSAIAAKRQKK